MKGAIGFVVGLIGLCFFASVSMIIPMTTRHNEGFILFLFLLVVAFVFLNIMVVGFYRILIHLYEGALYPDDPYYHPQRGRALFFIGYIGLLATLGFVLLLAVLPELMRFRMAHREIEMFLSLCWFVGWIFLGLLLGGVVLMLRDVHQRLFFGARHRRSEEEIDLDISVARRLPRRDERADRGPSRRADEDDRTEDQRIPKPWDERDSR